MKIDYSVFFKTSYEKGNISDESYDYFFSGYDNCDRTKFVFNKIIANEKLWFLFPQYNLNASDVTGGGKTYTNIHLKEDDYFVDFFSSKIIDCKSKICIDITGFLRPHLIFLIKFLYINGAKVIDFLYTEQNTIRRQRKPISRDLLRK